MYFECVGYLNLTLVKAVIYFGVTSEVSNVFWAQHELIAEPPYIVKLFKINDTSFMGWYNIK